MQKPCGSFLWWSAFPYRPKILNLYHISSVKKNYETENSYFKERYLKKVKSNYFIVRPKVDQRAGQLSLPHLGIFLILN